LMPSAIVVGGGLAGLATAAALGDAGFQVDLFEARAFLGGRASSFRVSPDSELIDNCQHILLRCCVNLLDFYGRLGVADRIQFHKELYFVEPGGRVSRFRAGWLPPPLHFLGAFLRLRFLGTGDKLAIVRGLAALGRERKRRGDLERISMLEWLREKGQPRRAIERFWRPVLVSAVNEELDRMAARHGFQVLWTGFLAGADSYELGVPSVPLGELYAPGVWERWENIRIHLGCVVERVAIEEGAARGVVVGGETRRADYYVCATPFERVSALAPGLELDLTAFEHSPITGIHLWFDRAVMDLPHVTLLDRTIQWVFNKREGKYVLAVVSAARGLIEMSRGEVIELAMGELAEFFPRVREARLEKAEVIKEVRATFSARPGVEASRPASETSVANLFLAGDWTRTRWPATMEGAVRSGYLAAEAVTKAAGRPRRFLIRDE
jgi:squalene-associated FAD-dependent desaturase